MSFTTRPELRGTFGMVASTHWLASAAGMAVLERGGNAFDAAVAAGFVLQVVEPHLNGPGGEVPADLLLRGADERAGALRPGPGAGRRHDRRATRALGLDLVPGTGPLAAVRAGRVRRLAAAAARLRDAGARRRAGATRSATRATGSRCVPGIAVAIERGRALRRVDGTRPRSVLPAPRPGAAVPQPARWPTTYAAARASRPGGVARGADRRGARRLVPRAGSRGGGRPFFAAEDGLLTGDDLARLAATVEEPASLDFRGWHGLQDRAVGPGAGVPAAARAARRASTSAAMGLGRLRPHA